ncbi:MAG: cell division protein FtsA [Verrucomicrobiota bacterium]|jgi:cell division protein FtsA|nr:cell division protein FtsA [Opitutae bacterium]MEC8656699.1 cell division protein FtsA [Verrucomicrobiota bacterium]MEC8777779.1 cell division protein FtsA [Verrucomicrobiota bacterium]MEC8792091.1 cell division protein FtsA [Verrucomicrobiota bacterium]MED5279889.1 cell division protein FtsA [Verrucomicrobiota bacterium]|tara:strand:+ start:1266 stop:2474 length:1209 start_codon:yes stop_codon:yes gene_type:complete
MSKIIGAVEIGTSQAKALVGEVGEDGSLNVVGMASRPNEGMRKGEIVDFRKAAAAVHAALEEAEKMSGTTVDSVYLAQTGAHLDGQMLRGSAFVASSDNRVAVDDLQRAESEAKRRQPETGRSYVHHVRTPIVLDEKVVEDPVGLIGKKIDVGYWSIDGDDQAIRSALHVISNYSLEVDDLILSSIASATMVAGPDLRRAGSLVIDLGAGVTDLVLYHQGYVAYTGVIPVGGDHVTGDLSMGLRILEPYAEKLKIEHGKASPDPSDDEEDVWIIGNKTIGDRSVSRKAISDVIHVRVVELFEIIRKELGSLLDANELKGGILLTGGGSQMPGIEQVAGKVLGLPVRKAGFPPGIEPELAQPENATVLGLLHYGLQDHSLPGQKKDQEQTGFLEKLAHTFGIG